MNIVNSIKSYPFTIIFVLIILIGILTLILNERIYATTKSNDCRCVSTGNCDYNFHYALYGYFKCGLGLDKKCACNGPEKFTHCDYPSKTICKIPNGPTGCNNECVNSTHCNNACVDECIGCVTRKRHGCNGAYAPCGDCHYYPTYF
ncbi:MAG: hypothetical protein N2169_07445 [bacterium]|nr:hypothetical protein [bacterium]